MIMLAQGGSNGVRSTHPTGDLDGEDHWGDLSNKHQALRVEFLSIQTFLSDVMRHKNGDIVQMMNDNHISCLGLAKMNTFWSS